jgi:hypothetical protein
MAPVTTMGSRCGQVAAPEVLVLDHETGTLEPTAHTDLLEFLVADLRRHL